MASHYGTRCPKCDYSSGNPDVCDCCGALISRIKARQLEEDEGPVFTERYVGYRGSRWTQIALVAAAIIAVLAFVVFSLRENRRTSDAIETGSIASVFTENFDEEVTQYTATPVLVDFYATWCGPCKQLAPKLEQLASDYTTKLKVVKVDIDRDPDIAERFRVQVIPTLVLIKDGKEIERTIGPLPLPQLKSRFGPHL